MGPPHCKKVLFIVSEIEEGYFVCHEMGVVMWKKVGRYVLDAVDKSTHIAAYFRENFCAPY